VLFLLIFSQSHEIMDSVTTGNPIAPSLATSASSEYNAESELDKLETMLEYIAETYPEREDYRSMEYMTVFERYNQINEWRDCISKNIRTQIQRTLQRCRVKTWI
jgi:hypothetical protein